MRFILFVLFGVGGMLVVLALGVVILNDDETIEVAPQTETVEVDANRSNNVDQVAAEKGSGELREKIDLEPSSIDTKQDIEPELRIELARVKPDGAAVFAGNAPSGAAISIFENKILLGKTTVNENGEWVVVFEKLLGPGQHLISVAAELEDGVKLMAETSIAIEIYKDQATRPLVALLPENKIELPVLLQSPDDTVSEVGGDVSTSIRVARIAPRSLVWQDDDLISIEGHSRGGVRVTVTANGTHFGDALVLADGGWQVTGLVDKKRLDHSLEFALLDNSGQSVGQYVLPMRSRDLKKGLDGSQLVVVNKGDALWRIAYRSFGKGVRYIDIVRSNKGDIDNPDLIYPNQIFALPKNGHLE